MQDTELQSKIKGLIRDIPDFPKPGILFRDITTLLSDKEGLHLACEAMAKPFQNLGIEQVIGAESRGFIFGVAIAHSLKCGFVPIRKPGKLPSNKISESYELEYGTDSLEIHSDAVKPSQKVLLCDDLLATGGTMEACCKMVEKLGGEIMGVSFLIELAFLNGREKLSKYKVETVITY